MFIPKFAFVKKIWIKFLILADLPICLCGAMSPTPNSRIPLLIMSSKSYRKTFCVMLSIDGNPRLITIRYSNNNITLKLSIRRIQQI